VRIRKPFKRGGGNKILCPCPKSNIESFRCESIDGGDDGAVRVFKDKTHGPRRENPGEKERPSPAKEILDV
jgi:hypothetical protein